MNPCRPFFLSSPSLAKSCPELDGTLRGPTRSFECHERARNAIHEYFRHDRHDRRGRHGHHDRGVRDPIHNLRNNFQSLINVGNLLLAKSDFHN